MRKKSRLSMSRKYLNPRRKKLVKEESDCKLGTHFAKTLKSPMKHVIAKSPHLKTFSPRHVMISPHIHGMKRHYSCVKSPKSPFIKVKCGLSVKTPSKSPDEKRSKKCLGHLFKDLKESNKSYTDDFHANTPDRDYITSNLVEFEELLPTVFDRLSEKGHAEAVLTFFRLVSKEQFPLENIAFLLWLETVKWFGTDNACSMRYSEHTKKFWKLGYRMFGGRFIHFMSGHKNSGQLSVGQCAKGLIPTSTSDINFAIPNLNTLREFNPYSSEQYSQNSRQPGIFFDLIESLSEANNGKSCCVTFDGKKLKQGLSKTDGDVDILGFEKTQSLADKQAEQNDLVAPLKDLHESLNGMDNVDLLLMDAKDICTMKTALVKIMSELSSQVLRLTDIRKKKAYAKEKLIERSGDSNWKNGKYVYAISAIIAMIYDIDTYLDLAHATLEELVGCICYVDGSSPTDGDKINLEKCDKYVAIDKSDVQTTDTRKIKQRSQTWFSARKVAKVTGSTMYGAIGLDGLQKLKEHFDKVVCGLPEKDRTSKVKEALQYGTENEINAAATFVGRVLPLMYPGCVAFEEGYLEYGEFKGNPFMIISPDGSVRSSMENNKTIAAIELKCPLQECHREMPPRYLLQCLSQIEALDVEELIYLSWRPDISTVFKVKRNSALFQRAYNLCEKLYSNETPRRATKLPEEIKQLRQDIIKECKSDDKVKFLFVVRSLKHATHRETKYTEDSFYTPRVALLLETVLNLYEKHYQLSRQPATEAVVFLCCDLNREWKHDSLRSAPICWFPKGYSLDTDTMRSVLEKVLDICKLYGLHIPAISFDGQWHNICVRNVDGDPLTLYQLQRDVWRRVERMNKSTILQEIKRLNTGKIWQVETVYEQECNKQKKVIAAKQIHKLLPKLSPRVFKHRETESRMKAAAGKQKCDTKVDESLAELETIAEAEDCNVIFKDGLGSETNDSIKDYNQQDLLDTTAVLSDQDNQTNSAPVECSEDQCNVSEETLSSDICTTQMGAQEIATLDEQNASYFKQADVETLLAMFRADNNCNKTGLWDNKDADFLKSSLASSEKLSKLRDVEIKIISRYLNKTVLKVGNRIKENETKGKKLCRICALVGLDYRDKTPVNAKTNKVQRLADLAFAHFQKFYKKSDLNIIYAEYIWPEEELKWKAKCATLNCDSDVQPQVWFYTAGISKLRAQLEVSCIDSTHLLTRIRRKICKSGINGLSNNPWKKVAKDGKTTLSAAMIEAVTEPMSVSVALTHFTEDVEDQMRINGDRSAADLCSDIREWWKAEDNPGISAKMRIKMRQKLRQRLLNLVNFSHFPPPGMFVHGWPVQLWEALIANIDAKTLLHSICKGHSYNVRAFSSMMGETFFSELALYDRRGQGTVSAREFGQFINSVIEQLNMRLDPERMFCYRTSRKTVYQLVDKAEQNEDEYDTEALATGDDVTVLDNPFDKPERSRIKGKKKVSMIDKDRNALKRGSLGVRWENARRNESKLLPTVRMGIELD